MALTPRVVVLLSALAALLQSSFGFHTVEQREGLIALYTSTNGASWRRNDGWASQSANECQWYGIKCTDEGEISEIHLSHNNLAGTLPAKFFHELPHLRSMFLQNNQIFSTLPPTVGDMTNAAVLWFHENRLSGSIPEEFGNIGDNLQQLYLSDNLLASTIPSELSQLTGLRKLLVGENRLVGTVPDSLSSLVNLRALHIQHNMLTGTLLNMSNFAQLNELRVEGNQLVGPVPSLVGHAFHEIRLDHNMLTATTEDAAAICSHLAPGGRHSCVVLPQHPAREEL